MQLVGSGDEIDSDIKVKEENCLNKILERSESAKGVLTVVITSLVYKHLNPSQDIRKHQTSIDGGYSGRGFDTKYVTPFLKSKKFPAMTTTGWLTRSLEQKVVYDSNYTGSVKPPELKTAFLGTLELVETGSDPQPMLEHLIQGLIIQRNKQVIKLAKPKSLPIGAIIKLLESHFDSKYVSEGASRLPVLALYAAYSCLINETKRFNGKSLLPLENHTSSDSQSGRIGDIDIVNEEDKPFEAVEVKHGIPITLQLVNDSFNKFSVTQVDRYYLLSTAGTDSSESLKIEKEVERIKNIHGCHVIVNGVIHSLKYYLRLLDDTSEFIEAYVDLIEVDKSLKFEHKKQWNAVVSSM